MRLFYPKSKGERQGAGHKKGGRVSARLQKTFSKGRSQIRHADGSLVVAGIQHRAVFHNGL